MGENEKSNRKKTMKVSYTICCPTMKYIISKHGSLAVSVLCNSFTQKATETQMVRT